jgi:hypothetical protein
MPVRDPKLSSLWQLHDLARIDRHRTIPLTTAVIFAQSVTTTTRLIDEPQSSEDEWVLDDGGTVPGGVLLRVPPAANAAMTTTPNWDVVIADSTNGQWIEPLLSATSGLVAMVIGEMETDDPTCLPDATTGMRPASAGGPDDVLGAPSPPFGLTSARTSRSKSTMP